MSNLPNRLTFVDIETTGCRISDRIIEIGLLRVEDDQLVGTFQTLINPNCFVPDEIVELTGINRAQLESSPTFNQIKRDLLKYFDDSVFVAHNARFDYSFIKNEFRREEMSFRAKQLCTVKLSRNLFPDFRHHNLDSIIERFNFKCQNRHRAFDDAKVLWDFWQKIKQNIDGKTLNKAVNFVLRKPATPVNIPQEQLDQLPESSGVYIFYGEKNDSAPKNPTDKLSQMPLYVGKSVNLHDRVLSHFSSDYMSSTELRISQQIKSIEVIETAGELGALFLESDLIKKMQPLYNRMLRYSRAMVILKQEKNKDGYFKTTLDTADNIDTNNLSEVLGIFRNKKSAKQFLINLAGDHGLCEKLLGVDTTNQACFGYRLGKCQGACTSKEPSVKYNFRFIQAFSNSKFRPWPFNGPILIKEENINGKIEGFVIDKWCYLGTVKTDSGLSTSGLTNLNHLTKDLVFDLDTYKILLRYLSQPKNLKNVRALKTEVKEYPESFSTEYFTS